MEAHKGQNRRAVPYLQTVLCVLGVLVVTNAVGYQVSEDNCSKYEAGQTHQQTEGFKEELRILLIGKTGVGKSATGNTILRKQAFKSEITPSSVTTRCEKASVFVKGRKGTVIDSPGLFDGQVTDEDDVMNLIKNCIAFSSPGPHAILIVMKIDRFTEEDEKTVQIFQEIFGKDFSNHSMALFTHGYKLKDKNIHQFILNSAKLLNAVKRCKGLYYVMDNVDEDPEQLLDQMDKMVTVNGGGHYTTEMLQQAERAIEEEKRRILKEKEEEIKKEIEKLIMKLKGEALEEAVNAFIDK